MGSLGAWLCLASVGSYKLQEGVEGELHTLSVQWLRFLLRSPGEAENEPWTAAKRTLACIMAATKPVSVSLLLSLPLSLSLSLLQAPINTLRSVSFDLCAGSRQEAAALKIAAC